MVVYLMRLFDFGASDQWKSSEIDYLNLQPYKCQVDPR